jgi:hypothetical protein
MSAYRIRKILLANKNKLIVHQNFVIESQIDLEKVLISLYHEKSKIEYYINQLENLARMHQILVDQQTTYGVNEVENQIFNIFGLNPKSL